MSGRREEFEQLVERYERRIFNVALKLTGDEDLAAELTQETFVRAFRSWGRFRGDASAFTYLYRILVNLNKDRIASEIRQRERTVSLSQESEEGAELEIPDTAADPHEAVEKAEFRRKLHEAIQDLPLGYRECVVLRAFEGLSYEEIAEVMGITVEAVRSRLARARQHLRQALESYMGAGNGH
ncbi:MAG: RNA polymerase sigma factor [Fimbriimonadales bacterium]|jgi:RNA polymerase sigma-70 factor (ECF subfamily)|nr:MAG: RNA polymerase sigma factor [Fimbriimonadales bacterium]